MDTMQFYNTLDNRGSMTLSEQESLKDIIEEYPYFQTAIFAYLKGLYISDPDNFDEELERLSIFINDRKALFYHIMSEEYSQFFIRSGKCEIEEDKTSILLNAFFEGKESRNDDTGLEFSIFHSSLATTDYFSYMEAGAETETSVGNDSEAGTGTTMKHQNIIDSFIEKSAEDGGIRILINKEDMKEAPYPATDDDETGDELNDDLFFTETLSKIYIKQKKYEKAYKIIEHLSLNYPKKNTYFADQLSFLEKLIINSKFKNIK